MTNRHVWFVANNIRILTDTFKTITHVVEGDFVTAFERVQLAQTIVRSPNRQQGIGVHAQNVLSTDRCSRHDTSAVISTVTAGTDGTLCV